MALAPFDLLAAADPAPLARADPVNALRVEDPVAGCRRFTALLSTQRLHSHDCVETFAKKGSKKRLVPMHSGPWARGDVQRWN